MSKQFWKGPAGAGKTTAAVQHLRGLVENGVPSQHILVLVPHRALGLPYQRAFAAPDWPSGAQIDVATLGGIARRSLERFWPLVARKAGFAQPKREPTFLTIETSQYYMARLVNREVRTGVFDSVSVSPFNIMRQTLDNLSKAAVNGFPPDEIAERLIAAWGDRHSSRLLVYRATQALALEFRELCLAENLLDFSLQIELLMHHLLREPLFAQYMRTRYRHVVVDNLEENFPVVGDFLRWLWDDLESAVLIYDEDGGYRIFLGADPQGMGALQALCDDVVVHDASVALSASMMALTREIDAQLNGEPGPPLGSLPDDPTAAFTFAAHRFYPQMVDWVVEQIVALVKGGAPMREIVVLAPFLGDSLRFALETRLAEHDIETVSHRPSRALRDEPAARASLTLMVLAHPEWGFTPPRADVADALGQAIVELDPVRAWLLTQIVYRPGHDVLGSFDTIRTASQERITYVAGEKYEALRNWLVNYRKSGTNVPPDLFLRRLFGEVLSQPGYGFHEDLDAGRVVAQLVESAQRFRRTLYPYGVETWSDVGREYYDLVRQGLLGALYMTHWRDEERDAVFLAPAYTFLMRNRWVDYQFWIDVGSGFWWERIEQPLTHPYVLRRDFPAGQVWTDGMEFEARQEALRRLMLGLVRRCRKHVYAAIADLGEQGFEQRGPLLHLVQRLAQRHIHTGEA